MFESWPIQYSTVSKQRIILFHMSPKFRENHKLPCLMEIQCSRDSVASNGNKLLVIMSYSPQNGT